MDGAEPRSQAIQVRRKSQHLAFIRLALSFDSHSAGPSTRSGSDSVCLDSRVQSLHGATALISWVSGVVVWLRLYCLSILVSRAC